MKMVKNGLKIDSKKTQNLANSHQKAWAIAHENGKKWPKNSFQKTQNLARSHQNAWAIAMRMVKNGI